MRIKHSLIVDIADDTDMKDLLFSTDDTLAQVVVDTMTNATFGRFTGLDETVEIPLGSVSTVRGVFLKLTSTASVIINEGDPIQLSAAGGIAKFFLEAEITKIEVVAPDDDIGVTGIYAIWGDPTS